MPAASSAIQETIYLYIDVYVYVICCPIFEYMFGFMHAVEEFASFRVRKFEKISFFSTFGLSNNSRIKKSSML